MTNIVKLKRIKNKILLLSLMSMLSTNMTGCSNNNENESESSKVASLEDIKVILPANSVIDNEPVTTIPPSIIFPDEEEPIDPKIEVMDLINSGCIQKVYYATKDISINIPSYLSVNGVDEHVVLPKLECLEVYDQVDDKCLVKTNEYIGYVSTTDLEELLGTFVVIDISSQELKLYCDNEIILTAPVVTGKPSTPSDKGLFEIYDISGPRNLVGPDYKEPVDTMMKYNGGEGMHDAEYHEHEDGFKHGWRNPEEFGGETYLTDGSHGCINMLHDDVMVVKDYVEIGTKVLVKQ